VTDGIVSAFVRAEIERMRVRVSLQRKEILQLERAGISTASAELLLARMNTKIATCAPSGNDSRQNSR
jgi:hypothetical protein